MTSSGSPCRPKCFLSSWRRFIWGLLAHAGGEDARRTSIARVEGLPERRNCGSRGNRVGTAADQRVDVAAASRECDLAVLNGGRGVTAEMLLAEKPVLAVPLVLEQQMTGDAL